MQNDSTVTVDEPDQIVQLREQRPRLPTRSRMNLDFPVYHVLVVGFHHKKGCQLEYTYPPLAKELDKTVWKHLPTLAMPDGAHNFDHDFVYFHLPSLTNPLETVFGVGCFQQIDSDKLKNKSEEVTRSTVQKSVCVLSKFPLYGHIQVKMSLITAAYFREGDFDQVSILEEAFHNLNACLTADLLYTPEAFVGLSPRDLIYQFRHQIILLFKLLLLEKKVLFRGPSVGPLCSTLLTLVSLLPCTLEYGLTLSACSLSHEESIKPTQLNTFSNANTNKQSDTSLTNTDQMLESDIVLKSDEIPDFLAAVQMSPAEAGLPLSLFTKGYMCHPYLSLHYMDLLSNSRTRGFVVGATNVLFKHKKDLVDVIIEMQDSSIEIIDPTLKRILTLTTQDLRFAENLVKQVTNEDNFNCVGWEGGDEWIRAQFKYYIICLLRTSLTDQKECFGRDYMNCWTNTENWKEWSSYINSDDRDTPGIYSVCPGHPFGGAIGVGDMKIRFTHTMQNTEGGRRLNQAVASTGKAFGQTGKVVGGALTTAKGALTSWWNNETA